MKKYMLKNKISNTICALCLSFFCALVFMVGNTYAGAWTGGNVARDCSAVINSYGVAGIGYSRLVYTTGTGACAWSGLGWIYFVYDNNYTGDLTMVPSSSGQGGYTTVTSVCTNAEEGEGGFWHYGYLQWKSGISGSYNGYSYSINGMAAVGNPGHGWGEDTNYKSTERDRWIDGATYNNNWVPGYRGSAVNGTHVISKNGVQIAHSVEGADQDFVYQRYLKFLERHTNYSNKWDNGLSAFCDNKDHTDSYPKTANYDAEISASVGSRSGNYVAVNLTAKVKRPSGADFYVVNDYSLRNNYNSSENNGTTDINVGYSTGNITQTVWVEAPEDTNTRSVQVCGYIYYYSTITKASENATPSKSGWTYKQACTTVTITPSSGPEQNCPEMGITNTRYVGTTDAWMEFKNNTSTNTLKRGNTSGTYWAKPGDNFQFSYKMCGGSEFSRTYSNKEPAKGFSGSDINPKFNIYGQNDGSNDAAYLFGLSSSNPKTYTAGTDVNMYKSVTSPTSDNYKCEYTDGQRHAAGYYQVPAESGNSCQSAAVAKYSDVGGTFGQKMTFRYVKTKRYDVYHPRTCGNARTGYYDCSYYTYGTELDSSSDQTLTGTVKVPYNYALAPYVKHSNNNGITYAGASLSTQAYIATIPRVNKQVQDGAYATRTKETRIIIASFTMTGSSLPINNGVSSTSGSLSANTVCSVASDRSYGNCKSLQDSKAVLNQTNDMLNGSSDEDKTLTNGGSNVNGAVSAEVPYVVPGTKFCVAVGVSPADSHNTGDNRQINDTTQSAALSNNGSGYRVGPPACVTVAKKPTFSVESSQLVTNGNVKTSITNANSNTYGSWSEYGIVANGSVTGMASGAAYAYTSPYYGIGSFNMNSRSTNAGLSSASSACIYSQQTFGNSSCALGSATIIKNSVNANAVPEKVYDLYHMTSAEMNEGYQLKFGIRDIAKATRYFGQGNNRVSISGKQYVNFYAGGESACKYDSDLGRYVAPDPTSSAYAYDENHNRVSTVYCTTDGNKYMKVVGDAYYGGSSGIDYGGSGTSDLDHTYGSPRTTYRNPVFILDVEGTIIIDSDIRINNGGSDKFQAIDQLPTIIIFAKDVIISDTVTRLDAWIIAGLKSGSGEVNTCGYSHTGKSLIKTEDLTSDKCTSALTINGAVYAKKMILNRTFGGGGQSGDNADTIKSRFVQRGEVFNLRSDIYYWAYYQSQRNRILTTVYSRELPTRY